VVEPDAGGEVVKVWLERSRIRERAFLLDLGIHKDPSGLHCNDPEVFKQRFDEAIRRATPFADLVAADRARQCAEAWALCAPIAQHPCILDLFEQAYGAAGAVCCLSVYSSAVRSDYFVMFGCRSLGLFGPVA
jgi:hypothetical protein